MITVKNLSFSYSQLPFIENMNFQVRSGEIFGFLGPSGAGKSTLPHRQGEQDPLSRGSGGITKKLNCFIKIKTNPCPAKAGQGFIITDKCSYYGSQNSYIIVCKARSSELPP